MTMPFNLDHEIRVARLEEVIQIQTELFEMAIDWGGTWQFESSAPENNRLPDFYLKLAKCSAMLKVQLKYELETNSESPDSSIVLQ